MIITIHDRILRELDIIRNIYEGQHKKNDVNDFFPYPSLLNEEGYHVGNGRYLKDFDIFSQVELFNVQLYKKEFTERFEKTNNLTLIENQLKKTIKSRLRLEISTMLI